MIFSALLFCMNYVSGISFSGLKLEKTIGLIDFQKLVFLIFIICSYKAIYYFFRINNDFYINKRISFTRSDGERNSEDGVWDLATTNDTNFDKHSHNYENDIRRNINWVIERIIDLEKFLDKNDPKASLHPTKQPTDAIYDMKNNLEKTLTAHGDFLSFYKKEQRQEKFLRIIFMYLVPYLLYIFAIISSHKAAYPGGVYLYDFMAANIIDTINIFKSYINSLLN